MNDKITPQKHQQQQQPSFPYTYLVHSNTLNQSREPITPRGEGISNNNNNNSKELPYQQPNYLWQTEERERDQQEYITFLNQRRPYSRNSDTASVQFLNDDRLNSTNKFGIQNNNIKGSERIKQFESKEPKELFAKDIAQIRVTKQLNNNQQMTSREEREWVGDEKRREENKRSNEVDYSSNDFRIARAAIEEAAARQQNIRGPPDRLRRVKRIGDTTIITEHRDPYSFYWQLDQLKNSEQEPERIPPPVDYVLEEEEEEEEIQHPFLIIGMLIVVLDWKKKLNQKEKSEFAFVSLEKGRLLCHVFRCNQPAKEIAEALSNICGTLLRQKNYSRPSSFNGSTGLRRITRQSTPILPSPIEEQKKIIRCHFIGVTQVPRATGIEMLNEAVDRLLKEVRKERWTFVDVHISPSTIIIFEAKGVQRQIASCRVRYLSFLGIGRDTKHCAFIVAQSTDHFICYVFHTEPSANSLAKTIEAACKLRYQKVLDAHLSSPNESLSRSMPILEEWSKNQRGINNTHF
ncbi:hypothetical protein Mgra_00004155 [Meloidogyne graminicola]|uniref:PID domain-containing protein n=1 Tax=Meloidogyne graminicola TaxID=189291 RepID=A0A8S9ZSP5_9BILA|nr:hypothetical protein Mgra_00004155 [Meloidogyne graminicola]